jgi:anti-anti-sigma factor
MHITVEPRESHAILHLRGEFDTYYVPLLQEEIDGLLKAGVRHAALNLRLVKFVNSTALGAMIKASKLLDREGGKLVISRPSKFCRDILEKVGLDRVIPIFDTDEAAAAALISEGALPTADGDRIFEEDNSTVIFAPIDPKRIEHFIPDSGRGPTNPVHGHAFGSRWSGLGRMSGLDENSVWFTWSGGTMDLSPFEMAQFLAIGTNWRLKFRLPLLKPGFCEAVATVSEVEERPEGIKVRANFEELDAETRASIKQYAADMAYLKDELKKATDTAP